MGQAVFRRFMVRAGDVNALYLLLYLRSLTPIFDGDEREYRFNLARDAYYEAWAQIRREESE